VNTPAVDEAIHRAGPVLDGFLLHVADVFFRGDTPRITRFEAPWTAVATTHKPGGLVIRIPHADGGLGSSPAHAAVITDLIRSSLGDARAAGVQTPEVQIDYDCPESKLGSYVTFLRGVKTAFPCTPVVFTALPSWLENAHFRDLVRAAGGYVLQVHSLSLPKAGDTKALLCDVEAARAALRKATNVGVPFRVALPTYQCVVLLDGNGKRVDVISEGALPLANPGLRAIPVTSDPQALAALVAELKTHHSRLLTGIIWYRLPVDTDRMNWPWSTFQAVAAGRQPASHLDVVLTPDPRGYAVVEIRNTGESSESLPHHIAVTWKEGAFEAADGLNGYRVTAPQPAENLCRFELEKAPLFDLPPGKTVVAGWVRVRSASSLQVSTGAH
jgi:hypothetical protein